jgi:hypothetical protein
MPGFDLPVWPGLDRSDDLRRAREESARRSAERRERLMRHLADGRRSGTDSSAPAGEQVVDRDSDEGR